MTVRFFSINAENSFFEDFPANYMLNHENSSGSRMFSVRNTKHLMKTVSNISNNYIILVVKERNSWQVRAKREGSISGFSSNQGIIGDPYYFSLIPDRKIMLGFTTGPIGSLKAVGKVVLEQFNANRVDKISLSLIPKEKEYLTLHELPEYSSLHFKINSSSLIDLSDDAPDLIKNLGSAPYINSGIQLSLDLECSDSADSMLTKRNLIEIVSYLSESDSCSVLKVKGKNKEGNKVSLDFGNVFLNYKSELNIRNKFVDEAASIEILRSALESISNV